MSLPEISQEQIQHNAKSFRHKWEMPLFVLATVTTLFVLTLCLSVMAFGDKQLFSDDDFSFAQGIVFFVLSAPFMIFFIRFYKIAQDKSNAVRVGVKQFPALWKIYSALAEEMGFSEPPKLYVMNGNGVINAYALSCNARYKYIILHSELAMLCDKYPEIVRFVLAHELAHHKLHHVTLWRGTVSIIPNLIPTFGKSVTRAQEYSADRLAHAVCSEHQGTMATLAVGSYLQNQVDFAALLEQCEDEHKEWFVRFANLNSDHAVLVKRYKALHDIDEKGYGVHGEMI